jgi:hypothetical protein
LGRTIKEKEGLKEISKHNLKVNVVNHFKQHFAGVIIDKMRAKWTLWGLISLHQNEELSAVSNCADKLHFISLNGKEEGK